MIEYILPPLIGALIGSVTNGIALKMLFIPYKPWYIGKLQVPMTPGVIPKEQKRIAASIGRTVSVQFLNEDSIAESLTRQEIKDKFFEYADSIITDLDRDETVEQYINEKNWDETLKNINVWISAETEKLPEKLLAENYDEKIAKIVIAGISDTMNRTIYKLVEAFIPEIEKGLAEKIRKYIENNLTVFINDQIAKKEEELKALPVSSAADIARKYCDMYKETVWEKYCEFINKNKGVIVENVDVGSIIEEKINELDPRQVEKLINDLAKRELNALVYLGGVLGFLLGIINIFI